VVRSLQRPCALATNADVIRFILKNNTDKGMSRTEIKTNSENLILAGSETTATCLSGTMFYLGRNPDIMRIVVDEIRSRFATEDEITIKSTLDLTYMQACIEENLRMFPPVNASPTRVSPGDFVAGYYLPKNVRFLYIYAYLEDRTNGHEK
jgi:cytochrome P450